MPANSLEDNWWTRAHHGMFLRGRHMWVCLPSMDGRPLSMDSRIHEWDATHTQGLWLAYCFLNRFIWGKRRSRPLQEAYKKQLDSPVHHLVPVSSKRDASITVNQSFSLADAFPSWMGVPAIRGGWKVVIHGWNDPLMECNIAGGYYAMVPSLAKGKKGIITA